MSKSKPELLYIGDAVDRDLWQKNDRLNELGIYVLSKSGNLPDIILYDASQKRIIFIEAYHSTGPFTLDRVNAIKDYADVKQEHRLLLLLHLIPRQRCLSIIEKLHGIQIFGPLMNQHI